MKVLMMLCINNHRNNNLIFRNLDKSFRGDYEDGVFVFGNDHVNLMNDTLLLETPVNLIETYLRDVSETPSTNHP